MRTLRIVVSILALNAAVFAADPAATKSFDAMKSLQGSWAGKNSQGAPVGVVFRLTAGDSALMSEIQGHGPENMVSMIHMDNDRLLMTHYCGAGNQPRMQANMAPDGKSITFNFVDGTNIPTADSGHMQSVVFAIPDADHHTELWTFVDHGKQIQEYFQLERKK
jgi:hypothetical protein